MPTPEELAAEAEEALTKKINTIMHSTLADREKREGPRKAKEMADMFAANNTALVEQFKGLLPKIPEPGATGEGAGVASAAGSANKMTPEYLQLQEQVKKLNAKNEERDQEHAKLMKRIEQEQNAKLAAEGKSRSTEELTLLNQLLGEGKVRPAMMRMAAEDIHRRFVAREQQEVDGVIQYGDIKWKDAETGELIDPKKGIAKYLNSDEGKELLPARNAGGTGGGKPSPGGPTGAGKEFSFGDLGDKIVGNRG